MCAFQGLNKFTAKLGKHRAGQAFAEPACALRQHWKPKPIHRVCPSAETWLRRLRFGSLCKNLDSKELQRQQTAQREFVSPAPMTQESRKRSKTKHTAEKVCTQVSATRCNLFGRGTRAELVNWKLVPGAEFRPQWLTLSVARSPKSMLLQTSLILRVYELTKRLTESNVLALIRQA